MTGVQVKEAFTRMYPPAVLFSPKIISMPAVYSCLRDYLNSRGDNLVMHSTRRFIMTLASSFYDESEDRGLQSTLPAKYLLRGFSLLALLPLRRITAQRGIRVATLQLHREPQLERTRQLTT
eukprot:IDg7546t1